MITIFVTSIITNICLTLAAATDSRNYEQNLSVEGLAASSFSEAGKFTVFAIIVEQKLDTKFLKSSKGNEKWILCT